MSIKKKLSNVGTPVNMWGWVMMIEPFYDSNGIHYGDRVKIKTVAKVKHEGKPVSVYIDAIMKEGHATEALRPFNRPIPVHVQGKKIWQKAYTNAHKNDIEQTEFLMWVGMNNFGLKISVLDEIPTEVIEHYQATPPLITFGKYFNEKAATIAKEKKKRAKSLNM